MYRIIFFAGILFATILSASIIAESKQEKLAQTTLLQEILLEKESYSLQKDIQIEYALKNISNKPIDFTFNSNKQFDIWITKSEKEIYRWSDGKFFLTVVTNLTLQPGEIKKYNITWDQKDKSGNYIAPGAYTIYAQLTPSDKKLQPEPVKKNITIGLGSTDAIKISIRDAIENFESYEKKKVIIEAVYMGWSSDKIDPNISDGPPVTRSDWIITDETNAMYATGESILDPVNDKNKKVSILGVLKKTEKGKVYIKSEKVILLPIKAK